MAGPFLLSFAPHPIILFRGTELWLVPGCPLGLHTCVALHWLSLLLGTSFLLVYPANYSPFIRWLTSPPCAAFPTSPQTSLPQSAIPLPVRSPSAEQLGFSAKNSGFGGRQSFLPPRPIHYPALADSSSNGNAQSTYRRVGKDHMIYSWKPLEIPSMCFWLISCWTVVVSEANHTFPPVIPEPLAECLWRSLQWIFIKWKGE